MRISTKYLTNGNGTGHIRATGNGKQRTILFDHSRSIAQNHGDAAGTLALVLITGETARKVAAKTAKHRVENDGWHVFTMGE